MFLEFVCYKKTINLEWSLEKNITVIKTINLVLNKNNNNIRIMIINEQAETNHLTIRLIIKLKDSILECKNIIYIKLMECNQIQLIHDWCWWHKYVNYFIGILLLQARPCAFSYTILFSVPCFQIFSNKWNIFMVITTW